MTRLNLCAYLNGLVDYRRNPGGVQKYIHHIHLKGYLLQGSITFLSHNLFLSRINRNNLVSMLQEISCYLVAVPLLLWRETHYSYSFGLLQYFFYHFGFWIIFIEVILQIINALFIFSLSVMCDCRFIISPCQRIYQNGRGYT